MPRLIRMNALVPRVRLGAAHRVDIDPARTLMRISSLVTYPTSILMALLLVGCAAPYDRHVWNRLGVKPPISRESFESKLPRGWKHSLWGFYGRVQKEQYVVNTTDCYDVWSYPRRILTWHADDALIKIKYRQISGQ